MPPEGFKPFGGGGETMLHPIVIALLAVGILTIWLVQRRYVLVAFLVLAVLIPLQQQIVVAGAHMIVMRIVLLCAWVRLLHRMLSGSEFLAGGLRPLDKIVIAWTLSAVVTYTLQWQTMGALINRMGMLFTVFGTYFLLRHLVRTAADINRLFATFAFLCAVIAVLMIVEQATRHNMLADFGALAQPEIRNGRIRSQGPFQHPIIAGTFAATMSPIFFGLWWSRRARPVAAVGLMAATIMAVTSGSSTPILGYAAGALALCMWGIRNHMRAVRWAIVLVLLSLHMVMKAPVWALIGRIDILSGSTSWHRFELVNQFINRFGEWWLLGTRSNASWGTDMWDTVNGYVAAGISGGIAGLVLFIAIIVYAFKAVGRTLRSNCSGSKQRFCWSLGAALFANCMAFFGIAYFDQSVIFWYALLATILATASDTVEEHVAAPARGIYPRNWVQLNPLQSS